LRVLGHACVAISERSPAPGSGGVQRARRLAPETGTPQTGKAVPAVRAMTAIRYDSWGLAIKARQSDSIFSRSWSCRL
jgi:hypothetical protein